MGEGEVDGHTMKTGFKNEPQGNGGKQSPLDHQTFEDLWKRGPGVSDPEKKKKTKWVPEDHKLTCLKGGCLWLNTQEQF